MASPHARRAVRTRDDLAVVLPSRLLLLGVLAVVLAAGAFFVTKPAKQDTAQPVAHSQPASTTTSASQTPTPTKAATATKAPSRRPRQTPSASPTKSAHKHHHNHHHKRHHKRHHAVSVNRSAVYVEIFNNSSIQGLAASTGSRASDAGWNVVGEDNWVGDIPESTVYYPSRLASAAKLLAGDLGISRLRPAVAPMQGDRLTVILTSSYH